MKHTLLLAFSLCIVVSCSHVAKPKIEKFIWMDLRFNNYRDNQNFDPHYLQARQYLEFNDSLKSIRYVKNKIGLNQTEYFSLPESGIIIETIMKYLSHKNYPKCLSQNSIYNGGEYMLI